jgi:hypothetical protein
MPAIDHRPPSRRAIVVAAELARNGRGEAAAVIRDLIELTQAYQALCNAYRTGGRRVPEKALDAIRNLKWRIEEGK